MRTYDLIDRVTEAELLAVTTAGARRWLERNGWAYEYEDKDWTYFKKEGVEKKIVVTETYGHASIDARGFQFTVNQAATATGRPPRHILDEMTTDSRVVAECARVARKEASQ